MANQLSNTARNLSSNWKTASATAACATLGLSLVWVLADYKAWLDFGTGGTPPTFQGYLKITKFRILLALSGDNPKDVSKLSSEGPSYLTSEQLPDREGPRPKIISRTLPQRQHPLPLDPEVEQRLHALPKALAERYSQLLDLDLSKTEGRSTDAIYAKHDHPDRVASGRPTDRILGHEIAHAHPKDNSLHVWLSEGDARLVVEKGWGERFPLSSLGMVHQGWTFLYAPRTMKELDVIEEIVMAGVANLYGRKI